ncbi:MAG: 16S rRNA (uracil1498-N3)-methyltransferase [Flavobacteriales bacterium]|jgi:16S rRNA (uracil1498-N3)-methyltransferase
MQIFYIPNLDLDQLYLDKDESKHATKVLRKKTGDQAFVVDGKGSIYTIEFTIMAEKKVSFRILETKNTFQKRKHYLHLMVAPTKNIDRFEWFLEKATEIGVDRITPILCQNSERTVIKHERLHKIIVGAMKQSEKAYLPQLDPITPINETFKDTFEGQRFMAYCEEKPPAHLFHQLDKEIKQVQIYIGPEGDFSTKELEIAAANQISYINLGQSRLRTETAAITACHTSNLFHE